MNKLLLIIIDGWGISKNVSVSAISQAKTPFIDYCYKKYSNTQLKSSGLSVGLPDGQMGNSEVGHMNLGAGRIVYQNLIKINKSINDRSFFKNSILKKYFQYAKVKDKKIHLIGLLSDGGVHSHINHIFALLDAAYEKKLNKVFVHAFTDGRDTNPMSGKSYLIKLFKKFKTSTGSLATIIGRYYAMDRDQRWSRIKKAYDAMVKGIGNKSINAIKSIEDSYLKGITDEFIEPIVITKINGKEIAKIESGDVVICFNFRSDRSRQITEALTQKNFYEENIKKLNIYYLTMTIYNHKYKNIKVLFHEENIKDTLGEILEKNNKKKLRISETEKYPHVTFFFSGGREKLFKGEKRIFCPSPKILTYDLQPEMSAIQLCNKIIFELKKKKEDFLCLNFANLDMVGHTGIMKATINACEIVDKCAKQVCETAIYNNYAVIMLSDHGNAEYMINPDGTPNTSHTINEVPCFFMHKNIYPNLNKGKLGDISPTILEWMNIKKPDLMTGISLFSK